MTNRPCSYAVPLPCMYACMYVCMYVSAYLQKHSTYILIHIHTCIRYLVIEGMCTVTRFLLFKFDHSYVCMYVSTYLQTHTTYIHIRIHTRTCIHYLIFVFFIEGMCTMTRFLLFKFDYSFVFIHQQTYKHILHTYTYAYTHIHAHTTSRLKVCAQ
jgi:hypothetical protein